ncbi:coth-domain-containing protein [Piromyces finnis]|uniref:Coth-domain-containing protein n=1 Tax=Piromyces finnis TaxID=1754191 RepID=A0A1Y1VNA8_9FUNG|nr:coth-domain-containing protein [Piromyces finnis]|eukprot:ORX60895.1 coth-domain-containing protein [Piromyces finnis]
MKFLNIISTLSFLALSVNAGFWDNVNRTELFSIMEESVPEMRITLPEKKWKKMIEEGQVVEQEEKSETDYAANLKFIYEGKEENYDISFKFGGKSTATFTKPGYNIKIKGSENTLHGTKNIRLRSDLRDASMMRSKVTTDILQKSGLIATEVGYTELYINDEYMGFWVVSDSIKSKWIQRKFGVSEEQTKPLYQCRADFIRLDNGSAKQLCVNANEEYKDYMEPFNNFVDAVNAAKTREDLEKIMDVDNFIKYLAWEYLMGSWDHFSNVYGHNIYWYQQPNGKWVIIPYDHDIELGQELWTTYCKGTAPYCDYDDVDFARVPYDQFETGHPIIRTLVHNDDTKFRECLGDIVSKVFNPDTILIQLDKVKKLISPYVKRDRDTLAGRINKKGKEIIYTYEHFLGNTEYTYVHNIVNTVRDYGLKDWIRRRYEYVAAYYGINTEATTSDKKHKLIEPRPEPVILPYNLTVTSEKINDDYAYLTIQPPLPKYTPDKNYADDRVPVIGVNQYLLSKSENPSNPSKCWSEAFGYKCCTKGCKTIVNVIENGKYWGAENGEWCGIPDNCEFEKDECPGIKYGYECCEKCDVVETDELGQWGAINGEWCSIKKSCNKQ